MKKLLAVDGNSILNRAFYGIRALSNKDGFPTNALFGMVNIITKQTDALKPDYAAIAYDLKAPTFRHKMFTDYKAGRHAMPEELAAQMPVSRELAEALGFHVLELEGYEADDILGTLAQMAGEDSADCEAYILTGDRDSLQLIGERVHVLLATNSETIDMDESAFFAKYGVKSSQFVDVKALMGDSSDNIPGVPGIGEKTALKLISDYGSLDGVYEALPDSKLTATVRTKLENGHDSAYMSQKLARIFCDVPLGIMFEDLATRGIDNDKALSLFERLGFFKFIERFGLTHSAEPDKNITTDNSVPEITASDAQLLNALRDGYFAVTYNDGGEMYVSDTEHIYSYKGEPDGIWAFLNGNKIICYDCKALYGGLEAAGINWRGCYFDVMLGAYVDNSGQGNYELSKLVLAYTGESVRDGIPDAWYISRIWRQIEQKLEESGQKDLLFNIEMPLAAVLCDMELTGFMIDRAAIADYGRKLDETASALESNIFFHAGGEFNINSPKQLADVLFERLGLPSGKKTKTGYSTNAEILENLRKYHPIIDDILDYRQVVKLKGTYVEGLLKVADSEGRIHTVFRQTGTATGRLSSAEPNLQNIPIRTELGREMRKFFIPKNSNYVLIDADYSQIELRLLADISGDENMRKAFREGFDIHSSTACRIFGVEPEDVSVEMRKKAKAINFGILYGMGEFSLSKDLHVSVASAKKYINNYLASYPDIGLYLQNVIKGAYRDGYVTTMFGRRRYIPELAAQNKNIKSFGERVAMNSPIQGSAADIIKIAMVNVSRKLFESGIDAKLILQVHDELIVESARECADTALDILRTEMENAVKLSVPLDADAGMGENWYEAH